MDLQELLDKQEIYDVLARHVRGENRDDKELWLQTFWPDSECHNQIYQNWPVGSSEDPDAWEVSSAEEWVEKYWYALEPPNPPFFNMLGQVLIEVDGDVAFAEAYFVSYSQGMQHPSWAHPKEATTKITHRGTPRYRVGAAIEWLTAVVSETTKKLFTSAERAGTWFDAERATSIAIVASAARRPDYRDTTLTFTIALGEAPKSQRHWLKDFQ